MGHEISEFDITNRQLLPVNPHRRVGMWIDIGEARITRTIFGRAKVCVIREQDKKLRAWLLIALALVVLAAGAWQAWNASQQTEFLAAPPLPLSERVRVSAPIFQPDFAPTPDGAMSARHNPKTSSQTVIDSLSTRREPLGLKASVQMNAKPATTLTVNKPQTTPPTINNNTPSSQSSIQQPSRLSAPSQPLATTAAPPITQPAETPAEPLHEKEATLTPLPEDEKSGIEQP